MRFDDGKSTRTRKKKEIICCLYVISNHKPDTDPEPEPEPEPFHLNCFVGGIHVVLFEFFKCICTSVDCGTWSRTASPSNQISNNQHTDKEKRKEEKSKEKKNQMKLLHFDETISVWEIVKVFLWETICTYLIHSPTHSMVVVSLPFSHEKGYKNENGFFFLHSLNFVFLFFFFFYYPVQTNTDTVVTLFFSRFHAILYNMVLLAGSSKV